jgi:hypothetical protein
MMLTAAAMLMMAEPSRIDEIIGDMTLPHMAVPRGVGEAVDWRLKPRAAMGENPGEWTGFIMWGQLYAAEGVGEIPGVRVEIRHPQAWLKSKATGKWTLAQHTVRPEGAWYEESFADDKSKTSDAKTEESGGLSMTVTPGYNYHFWPESGRMLIDPKDMGGAYTAVQARLVLEPGADPQRLKDAQKKLMMSVGADYWKSLDAQWDQWKTNGDLAIARFRFVTPEWQWFHMCTRPAEDIRRDPPPAPKGSE